MNATQIIANLPQADGKSTCKVDEHGNKHWYNKNGQLHRLDGPAAEQADGSKLWYVNDECHRLDGPACEYANGYKYWYVNGERHRLDGPAVERADGTKVWYYKGKLIDVDNQADFEAELIGYRI